MNRIKILDSALAGRIAAGEVITNPAAAVKELVENAIDAGSSAVTIETKDGGKSYIRVTDNGSGIHPEDLLLSVQKHATSKIFDFEDIKNIGSLGFRGEALSSIAAVSRLTIKTRVAGEMEGAVLKETPNGFSAMPAGLPDGTTVTVENLFYNVPARMKFLKSAQAESAAITDLVTRLVLSRPDISFKYITNKTLQLQSPGTGDLMDAVLTIYGRDIKHRLFAIKGASENFVISGFISNPNYLFKSPKNQTILINQRYVRSKNISDALTRAYGERILKAHYPFAILDIRLPFSEVDVNVHPSKTSVMIQNEGALLSLLDAAAKDALTEAALPKIEIRKEKEERETDDYPPIDREIPTIENIFEEMDIDLPKTKIELNEQPFSSFEDFPVPLDIKETPPLLPEEKQQTIPEMENLIEYDLIGQLFGTYVLVQSGDTLYVIDQHAAHERINYERLKKEDTLLPQQLLFPFVQKLSQKDHDLLIENAQRLHSLGFEIEDFGVSTIKITALPQKTNQENILELLEDVIELLKNSTGTDITVLKDKIIRQACRISVKAGDRLSDLEMRELIAELSSGKNPPVCPHGRPVAVMITKEELEKGFKRRI